MKKKKICAGVLAHVDAGKTTLLEALLYTSGNIRKLGRVDTKNAYLDTYELERERGITIFSKQAMLSLENTQLTLTDTPGHIDFSAEMERTLQILDYAILVISAADGVQGHTKTVWELLKYYQIPTFLFINKMDQNGADKNKILAELRKNFGEGCIDFTEDTTEEFYENIAMTEEEVLELFLECGKIEHRHIQELIKKRSVFPCFFGSALKLQGIEELLYGIEKYTIEQNYGDEFGARVFKIARDEQGKRLTYLKITSGRLKVKALLPGNVLQEEKVNEIRIYSGEKYEAVQEAEAGTVCAVTGPAKTYAGQGLGSEESLAAPYLKPVLTYQIKFTDGTEPAAVLPKLRMLEEEEPELHIVWNEELQELHVQVMGEVQIEILKSILAERMGIQAEFDSGAIVYKETIKDTAEGVGHFEPLRHYAEVHLLLEPLKSGEGLVFASDCSEDMLSKNWQRLVLTHLKEKEHRGVLTGSAITDMKITLIAGRAHQKHTEGGDFRQATYRAVRQGLKEAESVLLEPYYEFRLELPEPMIGRAMTDIEKMHGNVEVPERNGELAVLTGSAPVVQMRDYPKEVIAYSKGEGKLYCRVKGYFPCHNQEEVVERIAYDSERDAANPTSSVFCAHGAGFTVEWDRVKDYMHVEGRNLKGKIEPEYQKNPKTSYSYEEEWIDTEEVDRIIERTFYANKSEKGMRKSNVFQKKKERIFTSQSVKSFQKEEKKEEYLLVDGYNVIFAWEELNELAKVSVEGARGRLMDILCNYQGMKKCNLILIFDAYRLEGHPTEILNYHNIHVVYTKEAETADQYIEKFAHENGRKYNVTVATSDGLEQIIIRGAGCRLLSARELKEEVETLNQKITSEYIETQGEHRNFLMSSLSAEAAEQMQKIMEEEET